ncbi:aromatic ring-hydroxylating oxygenase subunit alpha [Natrialbaceae archaeon A-gly3]
MPPTESEVSSNSSGSEEHADLLAEIEASLEEGKLPLKTFNSETTHELELDRLFGREWIYIGHESEVPEEGDYVRRYIAGDPFIFVRDMNGEIQVLFDSCRHRGAKLCRAEQGNTSHFRCPYHGWTFKNTGELVGVPQKEIAFKNLDLSEHGLHSAPRVDSYAGLVFASLSESGESLEEHLGEFTWYLDIQFKLPDGGMEVIGEPHRWVVETNWKTGADNFAGDSYHTGFAHHSIKQLGLGGDDTVGVAGAGDSKDRHIHCSGHTTSTRMLEGEDVFMTYPDEIVELFNPDNVTPEQYEVAKEALSFTGSVFPNLAFLNFGDITDDPNKEVTGFLGLRKWRPLGPNKTEIWSWAFAPKRASEEVKERIYKVYMSNFGPSGNFEQDDVSIWSGITDVADSTFAKQHKLELNYQMGTEEMSEVAFDEQWPGPGTVYAINLEEVGMQKFHDQWFDHLSTPRDVNELSRNCEQAGECELASESLANCERAEEGE